MEKQAMIVYLLTTKKKLLNILPKINCKSGNPF